MKSPKGKDTPKAPESNDQTPNDRAPDARHVKIIGRRFRVPASSRSRVVVGSLFVIGGILGFLPILGFWMIPLGLLILSVDMPAVRRLRRRAEVWLGRRVNNRSRTGQDQNRFGGKDRNADVEQAGKTAQDRGDDQLSR